MLITAMLNALPHLVRLAGWTAALIVAAVMVRNGGGRPERFFLGGAVLLLASSIVASVTSGLMPWLLNRLAAASQDYAEIGLTLSVVHIVNSLIALCGIILLVYAFWRKFKTTHESAGAD
jgi:hypothetical protein